jgi:hypothetical protein
MEVRTMTEQTTTEGTLSRYEATEMGITLDDAIRGFTGGQPEMLEGMTVEEIIEGWHDAGESFPWTEDALSRYLSETR